jgi:PAS domain S-box-containing protein
MGEPSKPPADLTPLQAEVGDRFGILPNFFRLSPEAPEITSHLWGFAKFGYLDNPLPPLFKERLFVYLSRFCEARYCITRHLGFLIGLGRPAGDAACPPETIDQVLRLIRRPLPRGEALEPYMEQLEALPSPLDALPDTESPMEVAVFACATHVFLQTPQAMRCLEALRYVFDGVALQHVLVFLTFVRTAHFWTKVHPELLLEEDVTDLLAVHEGLAECVRSDPEAAACATTQSLLNELADLQREQERAALLRTTLASIGDAVITTDARGRVTFLNDVAVQLTGWTHEEATGQPVETVFHIVNEYTGERVESPVAKVLREGVIVGLANHTILITKDGIRRPIDDSGSPIRVEDTIVGVVLVFRDVTERRRQQQALEERERQFRTLADSIPQLAWMADPDGEIFWYNRRWFEYTGTTLDEMEGWGWQSVHDPTALPGVLDGWKESLATGTPFEMVFPLKASDGSFRPFLTRVHPVKDDYGRVVRWFGTNTDITEVTRIEEESERQRRLYDTVLSNTADFNYTFDLQGRFTYANRALLDLWRKDLSEAVGKNFFELNYNSDLAERLQRQIQRVIETRQPVRDQTPYTSASGKRYYEYIFVPVIGADGDVEAVAGSTRDVTEQRQIQEELRDVAARLSEADRRKDEFLATLAHELRNPLAPIRTGLEVMKFAKDDPATLEETRGTMERQVRQMVRLIDDLLDVSRITQGKLELRKCRVALADVVQSAIEATQPLIDEMNHEMTVTLPARTILLNADPSRVAQVFANLLNNSTKYTPEGGRISLSAELDGSEVVVTVQDNGVGIPAEMQSGIFELFSQIDRPLEKGCKGLGIGLTLVKRLVEMHGGAIEVDSDGVGQGSSFTVRLPIVVETDQGLRPAPIADEVNSSRHRILIVDDNADAAQMLSLVVKMLGNEIRVAGDGLLAIRAAEEFMPDVVLMDIGMPQMNGYEAARHIRGQLWGKEMVLVALTGWGQDEDKQRAIEAGFNYHLVKPAEPAELQQLLAQLHK